MTTRKPAVVQQGWATVRRMTLCPNCRTIQKAGTDCSICKCPVHPAEVEAVAVAAVGSRIT